MEGKTSQTKERVASNKMVFPELMFCAQNGYKIDALANRGLREDILKIRSRPLEENFEFDPESVWDEGTYSLKEMAINWVFLLGENASLSKWSDPAMAVVKEINTMSKGKCLLWTTRVKAIGAYPVVGLYIKTPPNE